GWRSTGPTPRPSGSRSVTTAPRSWSTTHSAHGGSGRSDRRRGATPISTRKESHAMTEFKKGDRVRGKLSHKPGIIVGPDSSDAYEVLTDDGVQRSWLTQDIEFVDPAPLRFSDVRTGDMITVEVKVESDGHSPTITFTDGIAEVNEFTGEVRIQGLSGWCWNDETTPEARLTAHIPAEPEWHRAKVIMGCYTEAGTPDEPEYWLLGWDGLFYSVNGTAEDYKLTNVTIIVDEHGQMRA